ncbi:Cellobiose 2-epimerase [Planctomycetes bacterium Pan216]|uniref:Cellobiose 2-epimerase n=1 Tax=Kolteria novifilia TaxID=2527975 RepID=A0A518B9X3_9BACT|nr:Cellobiose 2-epimerase [Planctomycetes bacterium Pan216]
MTATGNRLAHETSPYLLQHAHNPVDWFPWGSEALEKARAEQRPIFLSIGYSACHWCHVMERESFEDPETAKVMNDLFVNIKVDREERPDLDQIYMNAVQLMTRHGGWPMSVWLTPDLKPFFGGTYFPPERRHGMRSFQEILHAVNEAWVNRQKDVLESADQMVARLHDIAQLNAIDGELSVDLIENAARELQRYFDRTWGGIGQAPKFPHSVEYRLMLRAAQLTGNDDFEQLATFSLERMIRGGIFDQLGGGFHRYSTDARWLVPHFEKMLYDNALIPLACLEAYQATGRKIFKEATIATLDFVLREMTSPEGGFHSTLDADSEGVEGKFFVWSKAEVDEALDPRRSEIFCSCYDVTAAGNWEGNNIPHLPRSLEECAKLHDLPVDELESILAECRRVLFERRTERIAPGRDDKILTAWNGMMIDAFAMAASVLDLPRYAEAAGAAATFVLEQMRTPEGLLLRTHKDGQAKLNAYLEDYAYVANGLITLYEATFDAKWLKASLDLVDKMVDQCWDDQEGGFFFTGKDHERLITRGKDPQDGAIPSGNSMAATALARLAKLTDRGDLVEKLERTLRLFHDQMKKYPMASAQMLVALGVHLGPTYEMALAGNGLEEESQEILRSIHGRFLPNKVIAFWDPTGEGGQPLVKLLEGKQALDDKPTLYICRDFSCQQPAIGHVAAKEALDELTAPSAS